MTCTLESIPGGWRATSSEWVVEGPTRDYVLFEVLRLAGVEVKEVVRPEERW